jgi:hypothetical protein
MSSLHRFEILMSSLPQTARGKIKLFRVSDPSTAQGKEEKAIIVASRFPKVSIVLFFGHH